MPYSAYIQYVRTYSICMSINTCRYVGMYVRMYIICYYVCMYVLYVKNV